MNQITTLPQAPIKGFNRLWVITAAAAILMVAILGARFLRNVQPTYLLAQIPDQGIESIFGIHLTQISITAGGGLVDLRYLVIDSDKILKFETDPRNSPVLIDRETGKQVRLVSLMEHKHSYETGKVYWEIFYNTKGVIRSGHPIDIRLGDYVVKNVMVQ